MAQTRQSYTTKLPNGDKVTVTTGAGRSGYSRTVTVRHSDGTGFSRTHRKNAGLFNTGLFDMGGYSQNIPEWAGGKKEPGWGTAIAVGFAVVLVVVLFGWPWMIHAPKVTKIALGLGWYAVLGIVLFLVVSNRRAKSVQLTKETLPGLPTAASASEGKWPKHLTTEWLVANGRELSPLDCRSLGAELRRRGWSDAEIWERFAPHLRFPPL